VHVVSTVNDTSVKENALELNNDAEEINTATCKEVKKIDDILTFKISQSLYPLSELINEYPRKGIRSSKL
jgi:hypothetical protein